MSGVTKQHVILCEGYDDRSFWKGWLLHLGCKDPTNGGRRTVNDAWGLPVRGRGRFLFHTPAGSSVIVQPCHGRSRAREAVEEYLDHRQAQRPERLILSLDSDAAGTDESPAWEQIRNIARTLGARNGGGKGFEVDGSRLDGVVWECDDQEPTSGIPSKQTLERLATAAIRAAYEDRGPAVQNWLDAPPDGLQTPKSFSYSYLAKWYADHGAADFYENLWRDPAIAQELERRLVAAGCWAPVGELVAD